MLRVRSGPQIRIPREGRPGSRVLYASGQFRLTWGRQARKFSDSVDLERFRAIHFGQKMTGDHPAGAVRAAASRRGTVLLYSHDSYGLGHLRRNTAIAHAVLSRAPDLRVVLLTGSPVAGEWPLPPGVELVRMPVAVKVGADRYEPAQPGSMAGLRAERAAIIKSTLVRLRPDVFLVDHTPLGIKGELKPALEVARAELAGTRVMIGLRDILDDAATVRQAWRAQGIYAVLEDLYHEVLVYGCRELYDVTRQYGFSRRLAGRTTFTGYIAKDPALEEPIEPSLAWDRVRRRGDRRILVMGGGGGDAADVFRVFVKAWSRLADRIQGQALMVMGPLMKPALADSIERRSRNATGITVLRSSKSMLSLVAGADVIVSMGGYNSVVEALSARKPMVLCPRVAPRQEQLIRAGLMAQLGLARVVQIERESSKALALAIQAALAEARPAAASWDAVDLGGADRVTEIVTSAVSRTRPELVTP